MAGRAIRLGTIVVVVAMSALAATSYEAPVSLNKGLDEYDGYSRNLYIGPAQLCVSFSAIDYRVRSVTWDHIQAVSRIVFYEKPYCQGKTMVGTGSFGSLRTGDYGMENKMKSVMIWESGMYPARGLIDVITEYEVATLTQNSTTV